MKKTNRGVILIGVIVAMLLSALDQVFIIATIIMGAAFVVVLFLTEIPLRRTTQNAMVEAEKELDTKPNIAEKPEKFIS